MKKSNWNASYSVSLSNAVGKDKMREIRKAIATANKGKRK